MALADTPAAIGADAVGRPELTHTTAAVIRRPLEVVAVRAGRGCGVVCGDDGADLAAAGAVARHELREWARVHESADVAGW